MRTGVTHTSHANVDTTKHPKALAWSHLLTYRDFFALTTAAKVQRGVIFKCEKVRSTLKVTLNGVLTRPIIWVSLTRMYKDWMLESFHA